ncbi:putative MAM and LDL-receptor class A domain-containing protein 1 [Apostichopus japonicus]|uniref:Putative MAM and LDL-receptor class A domain-containing protein 1 n=1 Tax=Stichopus japonicus TaxID=307972 RepID=A0A2G8KQF1_STIJA|nr:putative MAM and LDL-receptor class A domain-containing protein 1 [Apostichopus japonicus]
MPASPDSCFVFWYHMFGQGTGRLRAYKYGGTSPASVIFEATEALSDMWNLARVSITSTEEYQINMEAVSLSRNDVGHIAIDDMDLEPVPCSTLSTPKHRLVQLPQDQPEIGFVGSDCSVVTLDPVNKSLIWMILLLAIVGIGVCFLMIWLQSRSCCQQKRESTLTATYGCSEQPEMESDPNLPFLSTSGAIEVDDEETLV